MLTYTIDIILLYVNRTIMNTPTINWLREQRETRLSPLTIPQENEEEISSRTYLNKRYALEKTITESTQKMEAIIDNSNNLLQNLFETVETSAMINELLKDLQSLSINQEDYRAFDDCIQAVTKLHFKAFSQFENNLANKNKINVEELEKLLEIAYCCISLRDSDEDYNSDALNLSSNIYHTALDCHIANLSNQLPNAADFLFFNRLANFAFYSYENTEQLINAFELSLNQFSNIMSPLETYNEKAIYDEFYSNISKNNSYSC